MPSGLRKQSENKVAGGFARRVEHAPKPTFTGPFRPRLLRFLTSARNTQP